VNMSCVMRLEFVYEPIMSVVDGTQAPKSLASDW
jgi:hypothetical protein